MLTKLIFHDSYRHQESPTTVVPVTSSGADATWLRKHAAVLDVFSREISELKPDPKRTVLHIIALGDEEYYGPNRNGDAFSKEDTVTAHKTFKEIGHVFRNHKNTDPELAVGEVLATAHNDVMGRVELLIALDNDKCRQEVDMIERGELVPFSMGSLQDYDVCSVCGHKAETADQHCEHIQDMLCEVLDDGRVIYMKNPNPKFFDISIVFRPADRIAYSLRKVASRRHAVGGHVLAELFHVQTPSEPRFKRASVLAVAELLKELPVSSYKVVRPRKLQSQTSREWVKQAALRYGPDATLCALTKRKLLMPIDDFAELLLQLPAASYASYEFALPLSVVLDQCADASAVSMLSTCSDAAVPTIPDDVLEELVAAYSMDPEPVSRRTVVIVLEPAIVKQASQPDRDIGMGLAALYTCYKLGFVMRYVTDDRRVAKYAATMLRPICKTASDIHAVLRHT